MKAREFDEKFDDNEDISAYLDVSRAHRPEQEQKRVNVDFPLWMIHQLDRVGLGCIPLLPAVRSDAPVGRGTAGSSSYEGGL